MILISSALATPWIYPSATPLAQHDLAIPLEVGGGAALFIRSPSSHPNPYAYQGYDYDPGLFVHATVQPLPWLQANATIGAGIDGIVQPILGIRANFFEFDAIRLGAFIATTFQGSLTPSFRSIIVSHGLVLEMGTQHFRFDLALPFVGTEIVAPNQGGSGLTDMAAAWTPITPGAIFYQEFGFTGIFDVHSVRLGLIYTMINLSYRYNHEHWYAGGGAAADIPALVDSCWECGYLPLIFKIEGGYRF